MLTRLSISNYALIDEVNVSFDAALNIITGETGAGKSIMIGALGLITGNRADFSVLKNADKKCVVEAEFNLSALNLVKAFEEQDIDFDEHTIIRREVLPNGKSRAFVNDTPANLQQLKWLGEQLLDIHSQHQTQLLNTSEFQLSIVDTAAKTEKELTKYQKTFKEWSSAKSALEKLQNQEKDNKEDEEYLQFQLEELQKAKLDDVDITALEEEQQTLEKSEDIISALNEVNN
jgi:DNA repair protein RecN (Recombination protein N)